MLLAGQHVEILGWPREQTTLYGLVLSADDERAIVVLLSGTRHFSEGEIHQFPTTMLRPMQEHEQERLI